ncbi:MAG: adenylate kinase [Chitinophagaceae bacterium]
MFNLILFGPPGSGKGTQSENIIAANGLQHLSTGNLLRTEISNQTTLGLEAKRIMDQGQLVPDAVVIGMVGNFMDAHPEAKGFLFDGFPRTTAQCVALDALLEEKSSEINVVLALEVTEEELVKRLLGRGATSGRSDDTNETVIRARIQEYHDKTTAVATYYALFNKVVNIKGEGTVESIYADLKKEIDARI